MSITKTRAKQIIKEEVERVTEAFGYGRRGGGRYRGGDTTGYKGSYYDTPWYRQGGSGRMSDAEARERGGRGYDEPYEPDYPAGPRGGLVHSTVTIYVDPALAAEMNGNLGAKLDSAADLFIKRTGYDGMVGQLILGKNASGYYDIGARWTLAKSPEGYTFTIGDVVGRGARPSDAFHDAVAQGFEGSEVLGGGTGGGAPLVTVDGEGGELEEARLHKLAGILTD